MPQSRIRVAAMLTLHGIPPQLLSQLHAVGQPVPVIDDRPLVQRDPPDDSLKIGR